MLLSVDIGNTNINFGVFKAGKLLKKFALPTKSCCRALLKKKLGILRIDDAVICSVVPAATGVLVRCLKGLIAGKPYIIGKDIKVPIRNLYRKPAQVGQDRLVNAYAGIVLYGAPFIAVDFGTAITFDIISKKGEYLGGMILPGLQLSLDILGERAALLPRIKLEKPGEFIGRDTKNSMLSGVVYGLAALTDDLAVRIKDKIGKSAKVVGTGGSIALMKDYCKRLDRFDPDLTLKGLALLYEK